MRPFAPADRRIQTYDGAPTGQERNLLKASWDSKGEKIAAGSGDQSVAVWETRTGKLLHKLPGHRGAVNDVRFHPLGEPICKYPKSPFAFVPLPVLRSGPRATLQLSDRMVIMADWVWRTSEQFRLLALEADRRVVLCIDTPHR